MIIIIASLSRYIFNSAPQSERIIPPEGGTGNSYVGMRVDCSFFRRRDPAGIRGPLHPRPRIPRVSSERQVVTWRGLFGGGGEGARKNEGLRSVGLMRERLEKGEGRGSGGLFLLPGLD